MLDIRDLSFRYPSGEGCVVVKNWHLEAGTAVALIGPSGAGKTTLLKLIGGIMEPHEGEIGFDGVQVRALPPAARRTWRLRRLGVVFQDFALLDYLTVAENLLLPQTLADGVKAVHTARARALAEQLEVARYWDRPSAELSQGERQRVAIARALVHEPSLVLADEPTASLDGQRKQTAAKLMLADARSRQAVLIMVTHDPELLPLFDRVISLEELSQ